MPVLRDFSDTQAIEYTIQRLIGSGMDPKTENNPYLGFIYTSFQERATKVRGTLSAITLLHVHALTCMQGMPTRT